MGRCIVGIALFFCAYGYAWAQKNITGVLMDMEGNALEGGRISVLGTDSVAITGTLSDAKGRFSLQLKPGNYILSVSYIGFQTKYISLQVKQDKKYNLEIIVLPSNLAISPIEILDNTYDNFKRSPGSVSRLDSRTISLIKPIGTQELFKYVPGVNVADDDGIGNSRLSIGIRGLNPRRSSRVLILEDGIPVQPAIYLYPNMYYNPPAERLDEVEIIKSSAAIRFGPQTMGGVINYITHRPKHGLNGTAQISGGTNNFLSAFTSAGGWGSEKIIPELQILFKTADGYRENNHFDQFNTTFKINLIPDSKNSFYIKANMNYENSDATYTGLTEYSFRKNPRFNPKKYDNFEVFRTALDVIYNVRYNEKIGSVTKFYTNYFDRSWWREKEVFALADQYETGDSIVPVPWFSDGNLVRVGGGKENFGNLRKFYVIGAEHTYELKHKLFKQDAQLIFGGRLHSDRFLNNKKIGKAPDAREGDYAQSLHWQTHSLAIYMSEEFTVLKKLKIIPGTRFEIFEQESVNRLANSIYRDRTTAVILPGLGMNYEIKNLNIFTGIHKGFTPPSDASLQMLDFGGVTGGSVDIKAEESWNTEFGIRGKIKGLTFETAVFNMLIKNMVNPVLGTKFTNLGMAQNRGAELMVSVEPVLFSNSFKLFPVINLNYTYLQTEILEGTIQSHSSTESVNIAGNELTYAPHHTFCASVSKLFFLKFTLRADYYYVSRQLTDLENLKIPENRGDQGPVPAYSIWGANLNYKWNESWSLFISGKNILNKVYIGSRLHSNPGQPEAYLSSGIIPGPARQINFGIKYNFHKRKS